MNDYDSARMLSLLAGLGYTRTADPKHADLVIFNTCSVRAKAEQKALSQLGRLKRLRQRNPRLKYVFAGCFAQRAAKELLARHPFLDLVLGTDAIGRLPRHIRALEAGQGPFVDIEFAPTYEEDVRDFGEFLPGKASPVAAFVTIMRGCNNFCAYCVVPYVRGRERSRPVAEILRECGHLVDRGVREITLLGQNVNSYGTGLDEHIDFTELLSRVHKISGLLRLRFTTSHPKDMSDRLCAAFGELSKLANHVHLPVQSGSDAVLARMRRGYTAEAYLSRIDRLRAARPDIAITSDLLVGFPGETEADFEQTMDLIRNVRYSNVFSFRYSERPGTEAARWPDDVPEETKITRLMRLQALQQRITLEEHERLVGRHVEALVERQQEPGHEYPWTGKSGCYREIHLRGAGIAVGDLVTVKCQQAFANHLFAEAVQRGS
jgi:tRNA-2-methylthio-N6-dimethylallyladenosine synthase